VKDPFKIYGPAVICFSGGRTSGLMLYRILAAHGGKLPSDVLVIFNNTGRERPETLDFVERCSCEWSVPMTWLEYRYQKDGTRVDGRKKKHTRPGGKPTFAVVDYATASRNGEPFEAVVDARNMLPNVVARFCTTEMKINTTRRHLESIGWREWTNVIGFRADEPQRVARMNNNSREGIDNVAPLATAGVMQADVMSFWKAHPFDLQLEQHEGNCDLCFLKGQGKLRRIMRTRPDLADWWVRMEERKSGHETGPDRFRVDRPRYSALLQLAQRPQLPGMEDDGPDELSIACHCTD
jgi:3'-phosphoadenosine 5'-phosphosulfate sulfotransferase (PAPS reductase)/FAD synthetase